MRFLENAYYKMVLGALCVPLFGKWFLKNYILIFLFLSLSLSSFNFCFGGLCLISTFTLLITTFLSTIGLLESNPLYGVVH